MKNRAHRKSGQTIIEFALVSVIFVFMLVLTVNAILAFTVHQYLSYAAFMGARAYQASGATVKESQTRALAELNNYIPGLKGQTSLSNMNLAFSFFSFPKPLAKIKRIYLPAPEEGLIGQERPQGGVGIRIEFAVPLVQFPISQQIYEQFSQISLAAESYLGREVSRDECRSYFDKFLLSFALSGVNSPNNAQASRTEGKFMEDNGC